MTWYVNNYMRFYTPASSAKSITLIREVKTSTVWWNIFEKFADNTAHQSAMWTSQRETLSRPLGPDHASVRARILLLRWLPGFLDTTQAYVGRMSF